MKFPIKFISANKPAPLLRRSFAIESILPAQILICGIGFYELYVNGTKVSKLLAPYISVPDHIMYYDSYDITKYLHTGENVIGIVLGNGMQNVFRYKQNQFETARWRGAPMVAMRLDINGDTLIESDAMFKTASSPIFFDDLRCGEYYDATMELPGWNSPGFDDSGWAAASPVSAPLGEPMLCTADPIVVTHELPAVGITKCASGYIYDFGVISAGVCRLSINGTRGQKITMTHGERLQDGELDTKQNAGLLPEGYFQKDIYICKGKHETYTPRFTYHGFRYVLVEGITDEQAVTGLLTYHVMNSDLREMGGFTCSNETANILQEITRRSTLANFYYFPTDCPQREKDGWTGDAALSAEHTLLNLSPEKSYAGWLRNIRKAQNEFGQIPNVVPTGGWSTQWGSNPAWDSVLVYLPYYTYVYRGCTEILQENATAICKYLRFLNELLQSGDGLIPATKLGDWCPPGRDMHDYKSPSIFTNSVISLDICQKAGFIFSVLDRQPEKKVALDMANVLRRSIRKRLYDPATYTALGGCQTSQAMLLYYDILEPDEKPAALEKLLQLIEETDNHMDTGILGARVIFHVLSRFGKSDLAFKMITQPTFPSYGNWVARGATSLWEEFQPEGGRVASLNHHFWGDISSWFIKCIVGINYNPSGTNHKEVQITPSFIDCLDYAEGFHITPFGKISVKWKRVAGQVLLEVSVPEMIKLNIVEKNSTK